MMFDNDGEYRKEIVDTLLEIWCEDKGYDKSSYSHFNREFLDGVWDFTWKLTYEDKQKGKGVRNFLTNNKKLRDERGRHEIYAAKCLLKTLCYLIDRIERKERYGKYYG